VNTKNTQNSTLTAKKQQKKKALMKYQNYLSKLDAQKNITKGDLENY